MRPQNTRRLLIAAGCLGALGGVMVIAGGLLDGQPVLSVVAHGVTLPLALICAGVGYTWKPDGDRSPRRTRHK